MFSALESSFSYFNSVLVAFNEFIVSQIEELHGPFNGKEDIFVHISNDMLAKC